MAHSRSLGYLGNQLFSFLVALQEGGSPRDLQWVHSFVMAWRDWPEAYIHLRMEARADLTWSAQIFAKVPHCHSYATPLARHPFASAFISYPLHVVSSHSLAPFTLTVTLSPLIVACRGRSKLLKTLQSSQNTERRISAPSTEAARAAGSLTRDHHGESPGRHRGTTMWGELSLSRSLQRPNAVSSGTSSVSRPTHLSGSPVPPIQTIS